MRPMFFAHTTAFLIASSLCASLPAIAQLPIAGTNSGIFVNPLPGSATTTGVGTNAFTFGNDLSGMGPNRFTFNAIPFNTQTEADFLVGTFTYFNGTSTSGTQIDSVDLRIGSNFTTPPAGLQVSTFGLNVISTPNTGTPDENADAVLLPSSYSSTIFMIGGTQYTLQLLGFRNVVGDGFLTSSNTRLNAREISTVSAQLFGRVTSNLTGVPEPGTLALLGAAGIAAMLLRRRRKA